MSEVSLKEAKHLLTIADQAGLTSHGMKQISTTNLLTLLFRGANTGTLDGVDPEEFAMFVGLIVLTEPHGLLRLYKKVMVPAIPGPFVASEKFTVNTSDSAEVKISGVGSNFKAWFLDCGKGVYSGPSKAIKVRCHILRRLGTDLPQPSNDGCILQECHGRGLTEMSLPSVFTLISMQPRGENGILSKRHENRFHVADKNLDLRTVSVSWTPDGWFITAKPLDDIKPANAGAQMFSRNSALD